MTKRSNKAPAKNFSQAALIKIEKEFFTLPNNLVKNATKQLATLQKKNSKLGKAATRASALAAKLEKKLSALQQSKKAIKRTVINALAKKHQAALKQHSALAKEHQTAVANAAPLEAFQEKFNFLTKQLSQLNKDWEAQKKSGVKDKKTVAQKAKAPKKREKQIEKMNTVAANITSIFAEEAEPAKV